METAPATAPAARPSPVLDVVTAMLGRITAGDGAGLAPLYGERAVLDATVPNWRIERVGAEAIAAEYATWFADPARIEEIEIHVDDDVVSLRYLLTWEQHGIPHAAHHCHLLRVQDERIVRDTAFCGGRWPAGLLAEMEATRA